MDNAWLLYRRGVKNKSKQLSLKHFWYQIYKGLLNFERISNISTLNKVMPTSARIMTNPVAERPLDVSKGILQ